MREVLPKILLEPKQLAIVGTGALSRFAVSLETSFMPQKRRLKRVRTYVGSGFFLWTSETGAFGLDA